VLGEIVSAVKKVTDMVAEIAASSREQALGIEQVNRAMTSMDTMTQQNSALVEQASAAAQALSQHATNLAQLISQYNVGGAPASPAPVRQANLKPVASKRTKFETPRGTAGKPAHPERRTPARPWNVPVKAQTDNAVAVEHVVGGEEHWKDF
jgi:uncharacterized protein with beta-barrel porin domain